MSTLVRSIVVLIIAAALAALVWSQFFGSPAVGARTAAQPTATALFLESGGTPVPSAGPTQAPAVTATHIAIATASPTATIPATESPVPFIAPTIGPVNLGAATLTPHPTAVNYGQLDHVILFDNGAQIALVRPQDKKVSGLSFLSAGSNKRPRYSGSWNFVYFNNGYWLGDIYGHQHPVAPPSAPGEEVFDAIPSPDGQYIAWQMVTSALVAGNTVNTGAARIVISDTTGGNAHTLLQQSAGKTYGDIPLIYGWRAGSPPTLLVQTNYAIPAMLGLHRGLQEFDPRTLDMVNDYLPPLGDASLPQGEVFGVGQSGSLIAFATRDTRLPSGEGPFPTTMAVMSASQRRIVQIDSTAAHKDKATKKLPAPRAYIFARQAYFSPDDSRIAYTRLDILYPQGALRPYVRPVACIANVDGSSRVDFGQDERVVGWLDDHTVVVRRENTHTNGLYTVDLTSGASKLILLGNALSVDGIIP